MCKCLNWLEVANHEVYHFNLYHQSLDAIRRPSNDIFSSHYINALYCVKKPNLQQCLYFGHMWYTSFLVSIRLKYKLCHIPLKWYIFVVVRRVTTWGPRTLCTIELGGPCQITEHNKLYHSCSYIVIENETHFVLKHPLYNVIKNKFFFPNLGCGIRQSQVLLPIGSSSWYWPLSQGGYYTSLPYEISNIHTILIYIKSHEPYGFPTLWKQKFLSFYNPLHKLNWGLSISKIDGSWTSHERIEVVIVDPLPWSPPTTRKSVNPTR